MRHGLSSRLKWDELIDPVLLGVFEGYAGAATCRGALPARFAEGRELGFDVAHGIHAIAGGIVAEGEETIEDFGQSAAIDSQVASTP